MSASLNFKGQLCDPAFTPPTVTPADRDFYNYRAFARSWANMPWHEYEYDKYRYGEKSVNITLRYLRDGTNSQNVGSS